MHTCPPCTFYRTLTDGIGINDEPVPSNVNLQDGAAVAESLAHSVSYVVVKTLDDTVSVAESIPNQGSSLLSDGVGVFDGLFQPTSVSLRYVVFQAHSPVNIMVTAPDGLRAGFSADGTEVNQLGANLTGPNAEPESVSVPDPGQGQYSVEVFGKPGASVNGSAFTVTAASVGEGGSPVSHWSYSGKATPSSQLFVPVSLLSDGTVTSSPSAGLPLPLILAVSAIVGFGALLVLIVPGRRSLLSRMRQRGWPSSSGQKLRSLPAPP